MSYPPPSSAPSAAPRWGRAFPLALAAGLTGLAACADDPATAPAAARPGAPRLATVASAGTLPTPVANTVKYRTAGKPHATGRDGNATLTARALLGPDGVTTVDVTTGQLDATTAAPGTFDKVQVKGLDPADLTRALWTDNYNALRKAGLATYSYSYKGLARGLPVQVQANISGIDARVDVVTLVEGVKLRPDLSVSRLQAPARVAPGVPVTIGATVAERNGDVGARADCVLYVDGAQADRARGIWVDAGGTVSCAFTKTLTAVGTHALKVAVEGVIPGDWDATNNAATGSLEVAAANDFYVYGWAYDQTYTPDYKYDYSYSWSDGTNTWSRAYGDAVNGNSREQGSYSNGWMPKEATFPFARIELSEASGGTSVAALAFENVQPDSWVEASDANGSYRSGCAWRYSDQTAAGSVWFTVCASRYTQASDNQTFEETWFQEQRYAGDVTYHGESYDRYWYNGQVYSDYTWNYDVTRQVGLPIVAFAGEQVRLTTVFTAANGTYTAALDVPLTAYSYANTRRAYACDPDYTYTSGTYSERSQVCWRDASSWSGRNGDAYAVPTATLTASATTP